jgi:cytochrome P450
MTAAPASLAMFLPFDPAGPAAAAGLYDVFREVRDTGPVVRGPAGVQAVLTHREVSAVLRDPRFGWGEAETVASHFGRDADGRVVRQFIFMDPPDHTRIRSLVTKAFSARMLERMRPRAEELVADLVREVREKAASGPVDLMALVAAPLPALLLGELMGVPPENLDRFREWSKAIARGLDPDFMLTPEEIAERQGARERFNEYFGELAARRRIEPGADLVSELVRAEAEGDRLSQVDLVTTCTLLLAAGYATTSNLIGNSMYGLLSHPEQQAVFRSAPDQVPAMVEELHRFDPPVQMVSRTALEPVEVAGSPVAAGEPVLLMIGAANRDPAVYADPDRLDLTRRSDKHLGFGLGIHFCVGAPLARLTAQVAIRMLAELDLELVDAEPAYAENLIMRGLAQLPVTVR